MLHPEPVHIDTDRLQLVEFNLEFRQAYIDMVQVPDYQTFYRESECLPEFSGHLVEQFIRAQQSERRLVFQLAVINERRFVGTVGLRITSDQTASFGIGIHPDCQGQGYGMEAGDALIEFGRSCLSVKQVYAETLAENLAAVELCRRLGMTNMERMPVISFKNTIWHPIRLSTEE